MGAMRRWRMRRVRMRRGSRMVVRSRIKRRWMKGRVVESLKLMMLMMVMVMIGRRR